MSSRKNQVPDHHKVTDAWEFKISISPKSSQNIVLVDF